MEKQVRGNSFNISEGRGIILRQKNKMERKAIKEKGDKDTKGVKVRKEKETKSLVINKFTKV